MEVECTPDWFTLARIKGQSMSHYILLLQVPLVHCQAITTLQTEKLHFVRQYRIHRSHHWRQRHLLSAGVLPTFTRRTTFTPSQR